MRKTNLEIEVKFAVFSLPEIKIKLDEAGATLSQPRTFECNYRFDTHSGALKHESKVLRLRKDSQSHLTFKGPQNGAPGIQVRKEIEFTVDDFESAHLFLEALGFEIFLIYEKYRTNYILGNTTVSLDEMPYGSFVEIEGPDTDTIRTVANRLGFSLDENIQKSYTELFNGLRKIMGFTFRDLTFENFSMYQQPVINLILKGII